MESSYDYSAEFYTFSNFLVISYGQELK